MKYYFIILLVFFASNSWAQPNYSEAVQFTIKEGLISNNLKDCVRDKKGFLWISSDMGITRYAGFNSLHFTDANSAIKDKNITKLLLNDSILIGLSRTNVYFVNTQTLKITSLNIPRNYGSYTDMISSTDSKLYISTDEGYIVKVDLIKNEKQIIKATTDGIYSIALDLNSNSNIFIVHQHIGDVLNFDIKNRTSIQFSSDNISLSTYDSRPRKIGLLLKGYNLLYRINNHQLERFEILSKKIKDFQVDNGRFAYITQENRIYLGQEKSAHNREIFLKGKGFDINKIYFDFQGDIIIISTQGLFILRENIPFEHIAEMNFDVSTTKVRRSIEEDKKRNRLFYFSYQGIEVFNTKLNKFEKKLTGIQFAFATANDGENIWIGTDGDGIYHLNLSDLSLKRVYKSINKFTNFNSIIKTSSGNLLLGTENELVNFDINTGIASSVDLVYQNRYYRNIHINNIIRKNKNEIWVSTNQGVFVLNEKNKVLSHYAVEESNEFHLPSNNVNTVYADSLGFYFGLDDDLYFISTNKKQKESILASKFLICNKVIDIKKDNKNRIWIATFNGLYLYDQAINTIRAFKAPYFLQNDEFNRRASFVNTDSQFYYGTVSEYIKINPESYASKINASIFSLNYISYKEGKNTKYIYNYDSVNQLKLSTKETALTISYFYNDLIKQNSGTYYYKIEGLYDQWIPVFDKKAIELFFLPSGSWKIDIKAVNNDDFITNQLTLNVFVPTIYYETIWFQFLVFLLIMLIFIALYKYQQYTQNKLMAFRIELANELHDMVGTAVTKTVYAAEGVLHDHKIEDKRLSLIVEYGRQINNSFRDALWSADERNDRVHNIIDRIIEIGYATVENTNFEFKFINNIGKENLPLKPRDKRIILLLVREALHNTLKHSTGDLITITLYKVDVKILLEIFDNGFNSAESLQFSTGMGIRGMIQRINRIGAEIDIQKNEKGFYIRLII